MRLATVATLAGLLSAAATALPAAAATDGREAFEITCASCHTLGAASSVSGPSLKGVAGRKLAALPDFKYSDGLKAKGGAWTDDALDAFLTSPYRYAPGARMFMSVPAAEDRAAIIAYLKSAK